MKKAATMYAETQDPDAYRQALRRSSTEKLKDDMKELEVQMKNLHTNEGVEGSKLTFNHAEGDVKIEDG